MMPCHGSLVAGVLRRCFSRDSRTTADRLTPLRRASFRASWASSLGKEIVVRMNFHRVCRYECSHGGRESAGHDQVGASLDGRGQNMNVVGVRQIEPGGACRVSRHSRIRKVLVHHRAGSFQYIHREIGTVLQNIPYP